MLCVAGCLCCLQGTTFRICTIGSMDYLVALDGATQRLVAADLIITSFSSRQVLQERTADGATSGQLAAGSHGGSSAGVAGGGTRSSRGNALLDYFYFAFEKYPANNSLGLVPLPTKASAEGKMPAFTCWEGAIPSSSLSLCF